MKRILILLAALLALGFDCGGDPVDDLLGDDCVIVSNCRGGTHPNGCVCDAKIRDDFECDLPGTKDPENCCKDTLDMCPY